MNRFKRIASRGWLNRALSALTFGYYPYVEQIVADWCVSHGLLHRWSTAAAPPYDWTATHAARQDWATSNTVRHGWTTSHPAWHRWVVTYKTRDC